MAGLKPLRPTRRLGQVDQGLPLQVLLRSRACECTGNGGMRRMRRSLQGSQGRLQGRTCRPDLGGPCKEEVSILAPGSVRSRAWPRNRCLRIRHGAQSKERLEKGREEEECRREGDSMRQNARVQQWSRSFWHVPGLIRRTKASRNTRCWHAVFCSLPAAFWLFLRLSIFCRLLPSAFLICWPGALSCLRAYKGDHNNTALLPNRISSRIAASIFGRKDMLRFWFVQ